MQNPRPTSPARTAAAALLLTMLHPFAALPAHATSSATHTSPTEHALKEGFNEVQREADKKVGMSRTQALSDAATEATANDLRTLSATDSKKYAASHFLGFYTVNGSTTGDVCRAEGIDVSIYVSAFQNKHATHFRRADAVMTASGFTTRHMLAEAEASRPMMERTIRQAMLDLAAALRQSTVADGCAYVAAHPFDVADAQSFGQQNPDVEAILMAD